MLKYSSCIIAGFTGIIILPKSLSCRRLRLPTSSLIVISSTLLWLRVNCWATSMSLFKKKNKKKTNKRYIRSRCNEYEVCSHFLNGRVGLKRQQSSVNSLQIRKWLVKVMEFFWKGDGIVGCFSVFLRQIHNPLKQNWESFISAIVSHCKDSCSIVMTTVEIKNKISMCWKLVVLPGRKAILILIKASLQSASRYLAFLW